VTVLVLGVDAERVDSASADLRSAYAKDLASTLGVAEASVLDLFGHGDSSTLSAASLSGQKGMRVSAFVTVPEGSSANALAEKLYTEGFREQIGNTTVDTLKDGSRTALIGQPSVPEVSIHPEAFVPLKVTTTVLTTTTEAATSTIVTMAATTTTTTAHKDVSSTKARDVAHDIPQSGARNGVLSHCWLLVLACAVAGAKSAPRE
jgi:hypothetical protein